MDVATFSVTVEDIIDSVADEDDDKGVEEHCERFLYFKTSNLHVRTKNEEGNNGVHKKQSGEAVGPNTRRNNSVNVVLAL